MSSPSGPSQTSALSPNFKSMLDAALAEYKKKTGDDLLAHWLATELQTCESVDSVMDILRDQAKAFEQSGDRKLMRWIDPLVHVLHAFSNALGDGVSLAFPPAKVIFTGIGALLAAAKDARASHCAVIDLFERIESFFKRLEVYNQISLTTKMAEVLVKIVIELLSILSIATKEVKRRRAKIFARKLLGRTDIEDALKRLDMLIQQEVQMAIAQILKVTSEVKDQVKDGAEKTNKAVQEVKWAQIEQDIHNWLSPPDPSTNYNIACKAQYEGTATWFFQGAKFKDWISIGSLLWIHGKPGSGKSILCSAIIKYVMSLRNAGQASLAFFYFDFRDEEKKQDIRNFVTSLLVQLSAYSSPCCRIVSRIYSTHGKGRQQPSNDVLMNCLREMLSLVATQQPVYLIVDALDECPDTSGMPTPREDVLNLLEGLVRMGIPNLRICVTSRPEIDIKNVLGLLASSAISLHDEHGQKRDISGYVRNAVYSDKKMQRWRSEEKELVIWELSKKVDGMFRWVFCQLEVLRHCLPASIRQTLDQLPESLDKTYVRVLGQMPQVNQAHAHRMLQCLVVAVRPLRVEELAELLAIELDAAQGGIPKYRAAWRLDDQTQAVLSTCSSLVTIVDERHGQVVQFSHFSVKEFLMSNRLGDFSRYCIRLVSAHTILTQACLGSLLHLDDQIDEKSANFFPLAQYAAQHWDEHARFEDVASRVKDGMEILFDPDKPHFAAWIRLHDVDTYRPRLSGSKISPKPKQNPLYYSVLCGFHDLAKHLAIKYPQHVNAICGRYGFPLFAAVSKGHIEVAELLLEHGANVDARETMGKTILLQVFSEPPRMHRPQHLEEYTEVVQMLLRHYADTNAQDGNGETPLHLLSKSQIDNEGSLNLALLLLKHGAEVNSRDNYNRTPLHLALERNRFKLAEILLEHGADAAAENINGRTTLHILSESSRDNEAVVLNLALFLLTHGTDVNRRDDRNNRSPLHMVIREGRFKFARLLLQHGADPNAEDNMGQTPLTELLRRRIYDFDDVGNVIKPRRAWLRHGAEDHETSLFNSDASVEDKTSETSVRQVSRGQYGSRERSAGVAQLLPEGGTDTDAQVNAQDDSHATPSYLQSNFSPVHMAQALLDHGANVNAHAKSPLDLSSRHLLEEHGVVHVHAQKTNQTPGPLHSALMYGRLDIARILLDGGATANSEDHSGQTQLHLAAKGKYADGIRISQLLLEYGADVHAQDKDNATPLHLASYNRNVAIAQVLLDGGAAPNSKGNLGRTPLHSVAGDGYLHFKDDGIRIAQLLLEHGADVNAQDEDNRTPLHLASYYGRDEIARVLLDGGATINSKGNRGRSPLHAVAEGEDHYTRDNVVFVAQLLRDRGADVNVLDDDDQTPLHLASYFGKIEIVLVLLYAGAYASAKDAQGQTPLHLVSQGAYRDPDGSRSDITRVLLENGADVNAQDNNHATPSDLASYHGKTEITAILLKYGGKTNAKIDQCQTTRQPRSASVDGAWSTEHI